MNSASCYSDDISSEKFLSLISSDKDIGCVFLGESENGFVISDHSDHAASKEPTNPCPEWIRRFL